MESIRCTLLIHSSGGILNQVSERMEGFLPQGAKMQESKRGLRPLWQNSAESPAPEQ